MTNPIESPGATGTRPGAAPAPFANENLLGAPGAGRYSLAGETGNESGLAAAKGTKVHDPYNRDGETGSERGAAAPAGSCEQRPVKHQPTAHELAWHPDPKHARADWVQAHEAQKNQPLDVDKNGIHVVKYGETMDDIARRYLVGQGKKPTGSEIANEVRSLVASNSDAYPGLAQNPDLVHPGWEIRMQPCGNVLPAEVHPQPQPHPREPHHRQHAEPHAPAPAPVERRPAALPAPQREVQPPPPPPRTGYAPQGYQYQPPGYAPQSYGYAPAVPGYGYGIPGVGVQFHIGPFAIGIGNGMPGFLPGGMMGRGNWMEEQRERQMRMYYLQRQYAQQQYGQTGYPYGGYNYEQNPSMYQYGATPRYNGYMGGYYR